MRGVQNLIKSNRNQIVITIFRLIWIQMDVCLVPNESENSKYNLISGLFIKISKIFLAAVADCRAMQENGVAMSRAGRAGRGMFPSYCDQLGKMN